MLKWKGNKPLALFMVLLMGITIFASYPKTSLAANGAKDGVPDFEFYYNEKGEQQGKLVTLFSEGNDAGTKLVKKTDEDAGKKEKWGMFFGGGVGNHYLYLTTPKDDTKVDLIKGGQHTVRVWVTYFDSYVPGANRGMVFEYSSSNRPDSSPWGARYQLPKSGTNTWRREPFTLTDMKFGRDLNNGADIRIAADNSDDAIIHSVEIEVLESKAPEKPANVKLVSVSHDSAELSWEFPTADRTLESISFYDVKGESETLIWKTASTPVPTSMTVPFDEPNKTYNISLKSDSNNKIIPMQSKGTTPIEVTTLDWSFGGNIQFNISGSSTKLPAGGGNAAARVRGSSHSDAPKTMTLLTALYDGDKMIEVQSDTYDVIEEDMLQPQAIVVPPLAEGNFVFRAYLWDDDTNMNILGPSSAIDENGVTIGEWKILNKKSGQVTVGRPQLNDEKVTVSGKTPAGEGKNVAIAVRNVDTRELHYIGQSVSGAGGAFNFEFSMNDAKSGKFGSFADGIYEMYVNGDDALISQRQEFAYTTKEGQGTVITDLNNADANAVKNMLINNGTDDNYHNRIVMTAMGVRMDGFDALSDANKTKLCQEIISRKPSGGYVAGAPELIKIFNEKLVVLYFEQVKGSIEQTKTVLNNYQDDILIFKTDSGKLYGELPAAEQTWAATVISERTGYASVSDLENIFKEANALYQINTADIGSLESRMYQNSARLKLDSNTSYQYYLTLDKTGKAYVNDIIILWLGRGNTYHTTAAFNDALTDAVNKWKNSRNSGVVGSGGGTPYMQNDKGTTTIIAPMNPIENNNNEIIPVVPPVFSDISGVPWAEESIIELEKRKVINGMEPGVFAPDAKVTREQFMKILLAAFSITNDNAACEFDDVAAGDWYYPYVASAVELGITNGIGDNRFGIGMEITRQEVAALAYRVAVYKKITLPAVNEPEQFADSESIDGYAAEAVAAMQTAGVINGMDGSFMPADSCTRAQASKIIYELLKIYETESEAK